MFTLFKRFFFFFLTNIAVLALLSIVMMIVEYFFPGLINRNGGMLGLLLYAGIIGFAGSFISLFLSKWSAKRAYGIVLLTKGEISDDKLQIVWDTVERIATMNHIKMPEVGYYESSDANAFATGYSKNASLVAVSTGLLEMMDKKAIEGVVGHEMAHVLNGDMVTLTLVQGVINTFVIFLSNILARVITNALAKDNESVSWLTYNAVYFVLQIVLGLLASLVVMYVSRAREYRADLGGAQYTSKESMLKGLSKLKEISGSLQAQKDPKMGAFMITEPDSFFSTHPSLDNRIKALEENYTLA